MGLRKLTPGSDVPNDINVVVEIPAHSDPVKYEVDKDTGTMHVDRFMSTAMYYPCDYGYIPSTLSEDGDPVDALVVCPFSLIPGSVIRCRPIGVLKMTDESGPDAKLLVVPVEKLTPRYKECNKPEDVGQHLLDAIEHFFGHYKDLEKNKWVKIDGWEDADSAKAEIEASIKRFNEQA
jgi:inorganic pyrophosphatase